MRLGTRHTYNVGVRSDLALDDVWATTFHTTPIQLAWNPIKLERCVVKSYRPTLNLNAPQAVNISEHGPISTPKATSSKNDLEHARSLCVLSPARSLHILFQAYGVLCKRVMWLRIFMRNCSDFRWNSLRSHFYSVLPNIIYSLCACSLRATQQRGTL